MNLSIPALPDDVDTLSAALAYARDGWYVAPVKAGTKDPGSVLGKGWQRQTSRDPQVLVSWFAGTDYGIALHAGRSGAVVLDVDSPDRLPPVVGEAFGAVPPPMQTTRAGDTVRGHYVYAQPEGRTLGNGLGRLPRGWGDVRGVNGVIIVAPSVHADEAHGGLYAWQQTGDVPVLPESVASLLGDASPSLDAASDATVAAFLAEHRSAERAELGAAWVALFRRHVSEGDSRHQRMVSVLAGAMKEARAGLVCASDAAAQLHDAFVSAVAQPPSGGKQGAARTGRAAQSEWDGLLAWAVAQALAADLDDVRRRVLEHAPVDPLTRLSDCCIGTTVAGSTPDTGAPEDADTEPGDTWAPVDLRDVVAGLLTGTLARLVPSIARRDDGGALFYRGKVNGIAGASGSGKSFTALATAVQEVAAGEHVVYVDLEDDAPGVVGRLLDMGADPDDVLQRFHYLHPDEALGEHARARLLAVVTEHTPSLVVIDSTGESMALEGAKPNDDDDTARWFRAFPAAVARLGPAVLVLDHVVKADDGGLWPIGSQRKRAAISGAQYMQTVVRPFSKDTAGVAKLLCAKDRHGTYRLGQKVAELTVTPGGGGMVDVALKAPAAESAASAAFRPTALMERVSQALITAAQPLSFRSIDERVIGKQKNVATAVDVLVREGYVARVDGPRSSHQHTSVRVYRQDCDPASDQFQPGDSRASSGAVTVSPSYNGTGETDTHRLPATVGRQSEDSRQSCDCGAPIASERTTHGKTACVTCESTSSAA